MSTSPTRIALLLAAGGLLGLLAVLRPGAVEQPPNQKSDGSAGPKPVAQQSAKANPKPSNATLFKNVKVFDGKSDKLTANTSVLVVGNKIEKIGGDVAVPKKATIIDGG